MPGVIEYENPIVSGFYPDPSICRVGRDYYLATSTFEYFPGVPILHSRDLVHFRAIGHALTRETQLPLADAGSSRGIFAPTLRHHEGTFYLITTNVDHGGNFFVTARDPSGPWSEPVWLDDPKGVDPSLFFDEDGTVYYTRQGGAERGGAHQSVLDLKTGRLVEPPRLVWEGTGGTWPEGPHLYKRNGYYYLLLSEGGTGYEHMLTCARSRSPWGPFEECPRNPILTHQARPEHPIQATGHGDWVETPDGSGFVVFLGIRPVGDRHHHLGRETFLAPLRWDEEGWPVVADGGPIETTMRTTGLPTPHPHPPEPERDDFDARSLSTHWNFVRNPVRSSYCLSERPGWLRLHGKEINLDGLGSPTWIGRRQAHFDCTIRVRCDFEPTRKGAEAGLTLRANDDNHYDLVVSWVGGERCVRLRTRVGAITAECAPVSLPPGPFELRIDAQAHEYSFSARSEDGVTRSLGAAPTSPLSSESAQTFTGVYVAMFAVSTLRRETPPADFDWFEYRPR